MLTTLLAIIFLIGIKATVVPDFWISVIGGAAVIVSLLALIRIESRR